MLPEALTIAAAALLDACAPRGVTIATAESCTGGLIIGCLTEIAGSSAMVDRGFVTYSNEAKAEMLGVPMDMIRSRGAVSEEVALAMAIGALAKSNASLSIAVTGVAGPGGGSPEKPVGLVHFGCAMTGRPTLHERHVFDGGRSAVRRETVRTALRMMADRLVD
ncbi:MAG: CinA family protein [Alphaproteobacteria bacterium]|nr:CinA family protein [Alphaproteobacteria bacterium]